MRVKSIDDQIEEIISEFNYHRVKGFLAHYHRQMVSASDLRIDLRKGLESFKKQITETEDRAMSYGNWNFAYKEITEGGVRSIVVTYSYFVEDYLTSPYE